MCEWVSVWMCGCVRPVAIAQLSLVGHHPCTFTTITHCRLSDIRTAADAPPLQLLWCGSDAVIVRWPELLFVVGPYGDSASWELAGEALLLVQEVGGHVRALHFV